MNSTLKFALVSAVTLMLAACGDKEAVSPIPETPTAPTAPAPKEIDTPSVSAEQLYGAANQEGLVAYASDRVFFEYDSSELTMSAQDMLRKQAAWLSHYSNVDVIVEGHCDERGTRDYNIALGARRASAVKEFLVAQGVSEGRLRTISYGKERPAVIGSGENSWSQNRRGVLVLN